MQTTQDRAPYNSLATPNSVTRNFQHRNFTATRPGLLQYWMGHAGRGMSELYDKIKGGVRFRKEVREKAGLGFELPNEFSSKIRVVGPNGPKLEKSRLEKVPASA